MEVSFEQKVRQRAYDIWVAAGKEDGLAELHWLSAEQALMGEISIPNAKVVRAAKPAAKPVAKSAAEPAAQTAAMAAKKPAVRRKGKVA